VIKFIIGIAISTVFIWLSIQGIEYEGLLNGMKNVRCIFLFPAVFITLCVSVLRSVRWEMILSPIEKISQKKLYPITCVGFMAITLIPLRIGELMRPYLISIKSQIPMSSALATIFLERVLDIFVILLILALSVLNSNLPDWLIKSGYSFFITFIILGFFLFFTYYKKDSSLDFLKFLFNKLPQRISIRIEGFFQNFYEGFGIISSPKQLVYILFQSVLIWIFSALQIYSLYLFQNIHLPLISAFVVLVITIIGISLPAAPGFLGNFQFACIMALSIYGIPKNEALLFSMVFYFFGIGITVLLGLAFLPFLKVSIKEIRKSFSKVFEHK